MNNENGFDLIIAVVFVISNQIVGLGPKSQDLVINFRLGEGETIPQFHLRALQIRSDIFCCKIKQNKSTTSQVNTSWNCQD